MKTVNIHARYLMAVVLIAASIVTARGQGTITFNAHANWSGTNYYEQGVQFRVMPVGNSDRIYIVPASNYSNFPFSTTPWMEFYFQGGYLAFSLTNGNTFGLASVALADLNVPSPKPLAITFNGFKADGSQVSMIFNTPGNGANGFETYWFDANFASGLTNVAIHATGLAMDNLAVTTINNAQSTKPAVPTPVRFGSPTNFPADGPRFLDVADFNNDGKADIAVANYHASLLFGLGSGTFAAALSITNTDYNPNSIAAGDFNNDGKQDLLVAYGYRGSVLLADGFGSFVRTNFNYPSGNFSYPKAAATRDFNNDGNLDIVLVGNNLLIGLGDGKENFVFTSTNISSSLSDVVVGDINGDGFDDLVLSQSYSWSSDVCVLFSNGDGTFATPQYYPCTSGAYHDSLALADFNGDGKPDLAVLNRDSTSVKIRLNNGEWFWTAKDYPVGFSPTSIATGDFNGDGKMDLVVRGSSAVKVLLGNGDGSFTIGSQISVISSSGGHGTMAVEDFNGDGLPDIVFVNNGSVAVMLNQTLPTLQITPLAGYNQISWLSAFGAFILESTTNLSTPGGWQPFPYPPVVIGNQKAVADWATGEQKFYRLRKP